MGQKAGGDMESGRLIEDAPRQGADNMAIDEMLLRQSSMSASPTLRFYFWDRPTVSLGYFQSLNAREAHAPSLTLPLVRRATGGGKCKKTSQKKQQENTK